jgi:hypothetical protein
MIKKMSLVLTFLFLIPTISIAQPQQNMMMIMQEVAMCMGKLDKNEMKALEQDSTQLSEEVESLCKQGNRDEAQKKVIAYSTKIMNSSVIKGMKKCTEKMPESMKGMMPAMDPKDIVGDFSKHHVCDEK